MSIDPASTMTCLSETLRSNNEERKVLEAELVEAASAKAQAAPAFSFPSLLSKAANRDEVQARAEQSTGLLVEQARAPAIHMQAGTLGSCLVCAFRSSAFQVNDAARLGFKLVELLSQGSYTLHRTSGRLEIEEAICISGVHSRLHSFEQPAFSLTHTQTIEAA